MHGNRAFQNLLILYWFHLKDIHDINELETFPNIIGSFWFTVTLKLTWVLNLGWLIWLIHLLIALYITNSIILVLITKLGNQNQKFWSKFFLVKCITYVQITKWTPNVPLGFILPMSIFTYLILCHCGKLCQIFSFAIGLKVAVEDQLTDSVVT